jgi:rod shape determining protein RodA
MIYSSSSTSTSSWLPSLSHLYGKQLFWIIISLSSLLATLLIPFTFWRNFSFVIYFLSILLLIAVLIFGKEIKGAQSWFSLGDFTFQPAEFAKMATALALAAFTASTNFKISDRQSLGTGILLFLVPGALILLQPDAGSTLVFMSFFILLYRLGLWHGYYIILFSALALFILSTVYGPSFVILVLLILASIFLFYNLHLASVMYLLIFVACLISSVIISDLYDRRIWAMILNGLVFFTLSSITLLHKKFNIIGIVTPLVVGGALFTYSTNFIINNFMEAHQRERINVWLQPSKCDPRGSLYNVIQSKVAIGSGGFYGKGFSEGSMTKLNYVPEQSTDFIFCTVGEEQGFLGVLALLVLYAVFIGRIFILSEDSRKPFIKNYGYALGGILFVHYSINIGMTMGLVPIIGIPLPLLSYGGSSLIFFSLMIGIFLRLQLDDR